MLFGSEQSAFAQLTDNTNQEPSVTTPVKITLDTNEEIRGIEHSIISNTEDIIIKKTGVYTILASGEFGRSTGQDARNCDLWYRVNDVDVPRTNSRLVLVGALSEDVLITQFIGTLQAGDILNIMMSVGAIGEGLGIKLISPPGEAVIPSMLFTMHEVI